LLPDTSAALDRVKPATEAVTASGPSPVSEPELHSASAPAAQLASAPAAPPVSKPATDPVTKPAAQPVSAPAAPPVGESVTHALAATAALPVSSPAVQANDEPATQVAKPAADAVVKPVTDAVKPVTAAITKPVTDTVVKAVTDAVKPVTAAITKPVTDTVVKPVTDAVKPVTAAITKPVTDTVVKAVTDAVKPVTAAITKPVTDTVVKPLATAVAKPLTTVVAKPLTDTVKPVMAAITEPVTSVTDALLVVVADTARGPLRIDALVPKVADTTAALPSVIGGLVAGVALNPQSLLEMETVHAVGLLPPLLGVGNALRVGALIDQLGAVVTTASGLPYGSARSIASFASPASLQSSPSLPSSGQALLPSDPAAQGTTATTPAAEMSAPANRVGSRTHASPVGDSGNGPGVPVPAAPAPVLPGSAPQRGAGGNGSHDVSAVIRAPWGGPGLDARGHWQQGPERATSRSDWPLDRPG
jgi:hypothetical protein